MSKRIEMHCPRWNKIAVNDFKNILIEMDYHYVMQEYM